MIEFVDDTSDTPEYKSKRSSKSKKKEFKPPKKISERYLYNSGLAYLQRFPASSMHFRTVMMRKIHKSCRHHEEQDIGECAEMLDALITKFLEMALLDDSAYLTGMVSSLRRRGLSAAQIYSKLQQKGYPRDDINQELKTHDLEEYQSESGGDIHTALIFARKRKLGPFDVLNKRDPKKSLAMMARAGYSYDIAKKTLAMREEDLPDNFRLFG